MIDWCKFRAPWIPPRQIGGDRVIVVAPDGERKWEKLRPLEVRGSHEAALHVSCCPITGRLLVDGNPVKFFQGHNLWGTEDLHGLAQATLIALRTRGVVEVPDAVIDGVGLGDFTLLRIDLTQMFSTGSRVRAMNALRQLGEVATMRYGGRGTIAENGTVYFRKHSRREAIKAYCKGRELEAKEHRLPADIAQREELVKYADDKLRIEVVLRAMHLREHGLDRAVNWCDTTASKLYAESLAKLEIPDMTELTGDALEALPPRLRLVHESWKAGHDLRVTLPRRTFYRYRGELLKYGIDIGVPQPKEASNVVRLRTIIECTPAQVPDWARGTSLYFEPRRAG